MATTTAAATQDVRIRLYDPADREPFLSLYETVWGQRKGRDWFEWRFEENPYRDGVQMVVAESGDEIIGVEPLLPFRVRTGTGTVDAYQPVDWLVHPDHRRQGVFTRMTEYLLQQYADRATLLFNFPSDALLPGLEKFDWRVVGDVPMRYRVHDPGHLYSGNGRLASTTTATLHLCGGVTKRLLSLLDRTDRRSTDVTVERHDGVPVETVRQLYARNVPRRFHLARDGGYLGWRFGNPRWRTTTYLGIRDGKPVVSAVVASERMGDSTCLNLLDVQPMNDLEGRAGAFRVVLSDILADHGEADLFRAPAHVYRDLLRRHCFWSDTTFPVSLATTTSTHVVRPLRNELTDDDWHLGGRELTDEDEWLLMPVDLDIE